MTETLNQVGFINKGFAISRAGAVAEGQGAGCCQLIKNVTRTQLLSLPSLPSPGCWPWPQAGSPQGCQMAEVLQASNPENRIQRKKRAMNVFPRSSADVLSALIGQKAVTWSFLNQSLAMKRFIPWIKLTPGCHPRTTESETLGVGLSELHFNSI